MKYRRSGRKRSHDDGNILNLDCQENDDEVKKTEGGATRDEGRRERK